MIIDQKMEFSAAQDVNSNTLSENVLAMSIDSANKSVDFGCGEPVWLVVKLASKSVSGTGTIGVSLETSEQANMSNAKVLSRSGDISATGLKPYQILYAVQLPSGDYQRYLALRYTLNGAVTGVKVDAFISKDVDLNRAYASGYQVV